MSHTNSLSNGQQFIEINELTPLVTTPETKSSRTTKRNKHTPMIQVNILLNSICVGWLKVSRPDVIKLCEFRRKIKREVGSLGRWSFLHQGAPCSVVQEDTMTLESILKEPQGDIFAGGDDVKVWIVRLRQGVLPFSKVKVGSVDNASSDSDNSGVSMGLAIMGFGQQDLRNLNTRTPGSPIYPQSLMPEAVSLFNLETSSMSFLNPPPEVGKSRIIIVAKKKHVFSLSTLATYLEKEPLTYSRENPIWVDIQGGADVFQACLPLFPTVHPLTLEDVVVNDTREKIEWFENYMLLIVRIPNVANPEQTEKVSILVFSNSLIVTHHCIELETLDDMRKKIWRRHRADKDVLHSCPDPAWVVYGIFDGIVDALIPLVSEIGKQVGDIERHVLLKSESDDQSILLQKIQKSRAFLTDLRQVLLPKHSIASNVMANVVSVEWMSAVPLPWWTDCQDHIAGMTDKLEVGNSDLESLQNVFLAKVSLNITMRSHHLNIVASKIGTLATVLLPLTFITGLFGMNVQVPWQKESNLFPFAGLCIFMFLLVFVLTIIFKLKKWL